MTYLHAYLGGILIGLAASILLLFCGRIAGNSGIISGLWTINQDRAFWKIFYIIGLLSGPFLYQQFSKIPFKIIYESSWPVLLIAGLLVGYGTRLGGGCTSGHGICGIARFSKRSIIATILFILSAIITVYIQKMITGERL